MREPAFWSLALADIADPDYTQVWIDVLPAHASADPSAWARNLLSTSALPRWVALALAGVAALRRRPAHCDRLAVSRVVGDEALVAVNARRLDVRVGVGVDEQNSLVRVVAAMRFKGASGRLASLPVRAGLALLARGMIARARRDMSGVTR